MAKRKEVILLKLKINTNDIPKWQTDSRLTNTDLKLVSQLVFSSLVKFIHGDSLNIQCTMSELIEDVKNTVTCHSDSIKNAFKVLVHDGVVVEK